MKKLFISLIVSVLIGVGLNAQTTAIYNFTTSNAAVLQDMSSGTTQLIGPSSHEVASALTDIGFTFDFMGVSYTQFSVNSGGQLSLGTIIQATEIDDAALNTSLLVPISGDNSILSTGKVHYMVQGTAPNRILIVEWKDLSIPTPDSDDPPVINPSTIQVYLYETGLIEFRYGVVGDNSESYETTVATFISSGNTDNTVKYIGADMISAIDASSAVPYPLITANINLLNQRLYSFSPIPSTPVVTVNNNCDGTSTLTASGYSGSLLWSTSETTPSITVSVGGDYTVTQTVFGFTGLPATGTAIPVPTVTGPMVAGLPATLDGTTITGQIYTTEPGMTGYIWKVSSAGTITDGGDGFNFVTVTWTNPDAQQSVSVNYQNGNGCISLSPSVYIINYYPYPAAIDPTIVPQFVDPVPHFAAGLRVDAKAGGNLMIKTVMVQQVALSTGTVTATGTIGVDANAGKGNYAAYAISKDNGATYGPAMWPAQTIEAQQGNQLTVQYINNLVGVHYSDFNILADQTLMMNGYALNGNPLVDPYKGDIPMVVHLHGGEMPSNSDGGPTAWFMPTGNDLKGPGFLYNASSLSTYPNKQEATTLWYHPHDQGLTRINVYTGLAGYYFLRGTAEEAAKLPGWSGDDKVQEVTPAGKSPTFNGTNTYLPEIELAVQDRMFNVKGELYWPVEPTNPDIHPYWTPEFFGNIMTVNGKSWPYLSVAPRKYRFRMLDGCNARFLNMWLQNLATSASGPKITVIGGDGGLLDSPADLDPASGKTLFMAPGERYDVVIDFTGVADGTVFTLMNDAAAPYPTGDPVIVGLTDRILQFVVNGKLIDATSGDPTGADKSQVPSNLRTDNPMIKLTDFNGGLTQGVTPAVKRQIILNEVEGPGGPIQVLYNNSHFDAVSPIPGAPLEFGGPTEMPTEGTTEMIQIINTTVDAHPIHIHLLQWQLVSRQNFNTTTYLSAYQAAWIPRGIPSWPVSMGYPGGAGSPYPYLTPNADGAVGGNPAITPFLQAPLMPANPEEMGWKDDIKAFPGQVTTFIVRVAPTDRAINSTPDQLLLPFDPSIGPGYVWHCHIIDHEDMDMMRPLIIKPSSLRFPQMTLQPQSLVSCIGNTETFTVAATSNTDISYQWQISVDGGTTWTNMANGAPYSGVMTAALQINPVDATLSTKLYRAQLTNADGMSTSNAALLTVGTSVPASVTISSDINVICAGDQVTFTPAPLGGGTTPTYEWFVNTVSKGTGSTYAYVPVNGDVVYALMTSNAPCATGSPATSNSVTLTVNPVIMASVTLDVSQNPVSQGDLVTFTATPQGGGTNPVYRWFINNGVIPATGDIYQYSPSDNDEVYVELTSNASPCLSGSPATSNTIKMSVNLGTSLNQTGNAKISIYSTNKDIFVNCTDEAKQIFIYDALGALIISEANVNGLKKFDMNNRPGGYYFVKVITQYSVCSEKVVLK